MDPSQQNFGGVDGQPAGGAPVNPAAGQEEEKWPHQTAGLLPNAAATAGTHTDPQQPQPAASKNPTSTTQIAQSEKPGHHPDKTSAAAAAKKKKDVKKKKK